MKLGILVLMVLLLLPKHSTFGTEASRRKVSVMFIPYDRLIAFRNLLCRGRSHCEMNFPTSYAQGMSTLRHSTYFIFEVFLPRLPLHRVLAVHLREHL